MIRHRVPESLRRHLQVLVDDAGSLRQLALRLKVSPSLLSMILSGTRRPTDRTLKLLGLERDYKVSG